MKKVIFTIIFVLFGVSLFFVPAMADPGDEHRNGPAGTQPRHGEWNDNDHAQPKGCWDGGACNS